jgi:site-specific recombinase XerD
MTTTIANFADTANAWQQALYAFLAEKHRRSGSLRTVEGYSRMLQDFFGRLGKQPDRVTTQDIFVYAHGLGLSGKQPSAITIGARIACLSSFYRFLIRMDIVQHNPCDRLQRPKVSPSPPRGLSGDQVQQLLAVVPGSPVGLRNRAIILTLVFTGRRRAEVLGMKVGDLSTEGKRADYTYRGKGGKKGRRELPRPSLDAIRAALGAFGKGSSHPCYQRSPYGRHARTRARDSPAAPFTAISSGTSVRRESHPPVSTSSAIPLPSYAGTLERRWKT